MEGSDATCTLPQVQEKKRASCLASNKVACPKNQKLRESLGAGILYKRCAFLARILLKANLLKLGTGCMGLELHMGLGPVLRMSLGPDPSCFPTLSIPLNN